MGSNALVEGHQSSLIKTLEHDSTALKLQREKHLLMRRYFSVGIIIHTVV